jgi:hypothetical protein
MRAHLRALALAWAAALFAAATPTHGGLLAHLLDLAAAEPTPALRAASAAPVPLSSAARACEACLATAQARRAAAAPPSSRALRPLGESRRVALPARPLAAGPPPVSDAPPRAPPAA